MSEFALERDAFQNGQAIPRRHSCEAEDARVRAVSASAFWAMRLNEERL
jgi:hypothetical protein